MRQLFVFIGKVLVKMNCLKGYKAGIFIYPVFYTGGAARKSDIIKIHKRKRTECVSTYQSIFGKSCSLYEVKQFAKINVKILIM